MACLIPVQYHKCRYPEDIKPTISEVAGHFDKTKIEITGEYSLHTEYSFTGRKFESSIIQKYHSICRVNKNGIPVANYALRRQYNYCQCH